MCNRWWVVKECMLQELMERAAAGEDRDLLLVELYANADTEAVD